MLRFLPGMFVNVQFPFKTSGKINQDFQESMMIPKTALVENGQLTGVYVVSSQNTAVLRWLKTEKHLEIRLKSIRFESERNLHCFFKGKLYNGAKIQVK
jgi:hypothetical protein